MARRNSEETLTTLVDPEPVNVNGRNTIQDVDDLVSLVSQETAIDKPIFGKHISSYRCIREYPIVSRNLTSGVFVFESLAHFTKFKDKEADAAPLLQTTSPMISGIFMRNTPFMVISKFSTGAKAEFCRVHFKVLGNRVSAYTLNFANGVTIVLINNNSQKPGVDFQFLGTKVRVLGVTMTTFGNGLIRAFIMPEETSTLTEGQPDNSALNKEVLSKNKFFNEIETQNRTAIQQNMKQQAAIGVPFATYADESTKLSNMFVKNGTMKMFSTSSNDENDLIFLSILLVLREQENRKSKGSVKSSPR